MTRQTKIIIGVIAGVLVLCLAICVVGGLWINMLGKNLTAEAKPDPQKAAQTASEIVDFTPPEGFQAMSGLKILGYNMAIYSNESSKTSVLMLMQMPGLTEINDATIRQMQQAVERQAGGGLEDTRIVETRDLTIRGKPARVIVQEGSTASENSIAIRQMMLAFQGKSGVAMLMLTTPANEWDQASIDRMIESMH